MGIYINSVEAISPQNTFQTEALFTESVSPVKDYFTSVTPEYRNLINPRLLRRMSRIIRMGVATSLSCLEKAGIEKPDAILVGTGLGCLEDTSRFLNQLIENKEQLLNPTAFIQSTHNSVSGQIALVLNCKCYNLTFTQKTISFNTALLEAVMLLNENAAQNVLVGGIDEIVDDSFSLLVKSGCAKASMESDIINSSTPGFVAGEGAIFFVLSNRINANTLAQIDDTELIHRYAGIEKLKINLMEFLKKNKLSIEDIDLVVSGKNGDSRFNTIYDKLNRLFTNSVVVVYKHLVGEFDTASAFGIFLASKIINKNIVPDIVRLNDIPKSKISRCLVFNYSKNRDFSFTLISKCGC